MTSVLFIHSQTLYAKVTIPVALACLERGWQVTFQVNRPVIFGKSTGFTAKFIRNHPTTVGVINPESLAFVADIIGLGEQWKKACGNIRYSLLEGQSSHRFDAVVGTTKNMKELRRFAAKDVPAITLGYQHIPVVARVGMPQAESVNIESSVFFSDNPFADQHDFSDIVSDCDVSLNGFTFLDRVYDSRPDTTYEKNKVLIFHPGGYRNIVSALNDDRATCYAAQKNFLERLCVPISRKGLTPVIKVHPLRAKFHDLCDLTVLAREVEQENDLAPDCIKIIGPKDWFWGDAFASAFILGFGSSSLYELWCAGLKNVYVGNFEGTARSQKFDFFNSIFLNTHDEFLRLVDDENAWAPKMDVLTANAFDGYHRLFEGDAVKTAMASIERAVALSSAPTPRL